MADASSSGPWSARRCPLQSGWLLPLLVVTAADHAAQVPHWLYHY